MKDNNERFIDWKYPVIKEGSQNIIVQNIDNLKLEIKLILVLLLI